MTDLDQSTRKIVQDLHRNLGKLQEHLSGFSADSESEVQHQFSKFLGMVLEGNVPSIVSTSEMLTTTEAADILFVTRPTVVKWVEQGKLNSVRVGTHRRLFANEVIKMAAELDKQRDEALTEFINS